MTTASARLPAAAELPSTQALQDVLYDILAVGVDSDASASTTHAIEVFLHEHARSPKPHEAFVAFFREQGLSLGQARSLAAEPQPLPPLKLVPAAAPRPIDPSHVQPADPIAFAATAPAAGLAAPAGTMTRPSAGVWAAVAVFALALGLGLGLGYRQLEAISTELDRARAEGRAQAQALDALQQRLEQVQAGVAESGTRIGRVEEQSALLLETLLPAAPEP